MGVQFVALPFFEKKVFISLIKNISALSAAQVLSAVCNFLSLMLIARMLGPDLQGEWYLYINAFTFGTVALGLGLSPAINHYLAAGKLNRKFLLGQLFFFAVVMGLLFFCILFLLNQHDLGSITLPELEKRNIILFGLGVHFLVLIFNQLLSSVLLAEGRFAQAAFITGLGAAALLVLYALLYFGLDGLPEAYFLWFIIANVFVLLIQCAFYLRGIYRIGGYQLNIRFFSKTTLFLLVSFAGWAYLANFVQFFNYKMDLWFIKAYETNASRLGIYGLAASLAQLIWLIPNAFHSVIFTNVSASKTLDYRRKVGAWSKKIFVLALGLAFVGYLLSYYLVPLLFGAVYQDVIEVFPFLLPGIVVFAPTMLVSGYFAGINRIDLNFKSSLIGFIICLVLNYLLVPVYSIYGAALASSVSYICSAAYLYFIFVRKDRLE